MGDEANPTRIAFSTHNSKCIGAWTLDSSLILLTKQSYPYQPGFYSNQVANIDQNTDKSFFEFWILNQFLHIKYKDVFAKKMELLAKIVSNYQPLTIFAKKLHLRCLTGLRIRLCNTCQNSRNYNDFKLKLDLERKYN